MLGHMRYQYGFWNRMRSEIDMIIEEIKKCLCKELNISSDIQMEYIDSNAPVCCPTKQKVQIVRRQDWNDVYQLSHELLHIAFYQHNGNTSLDEFVWVEEILCEAFSIFCLEKFCQDEKRQWFGYLLEDFYIRNGNVDKADYIKSLDELNQKVSGFKEFGVRQFVHPIALRIKNILDKDFSELLNFMNYKKYIGEDHFLVNGDNHILQVLYELQESLKG